MAEKPTVDCKHAVEDFLRGIQIYDSLQDEIDRLEGIASRRPGVKAKISEVIKHTRTVQADQIERNVQKLFEAIRKCQKVKE